jgi:hypothetical protein
MQASTSLPSLIKVSRVRKRDWPKTSRLHDANIMFLTYLRIRGNSSKTRKFYFALDEVNERDTKLTESIQALKHDEASPLSTRKSSICYKLRFFQEIVVH